MEEPGTALRIGSFGGANRVQLGEECPYSLCSSSHFFAGSIQSPPDASGRGSPASASPRDQCAPMKFRWREDEGGERAQAIRGPACDQGVGETVLVSHEPPGEESTDSDPRLP